LCSASPTVSPTSPPSCRVEWFRPRLPFATSHLPLWATSCIDTASGSTLPRGCRSRAGPFDYEVRREKRRLCDHREHAAEERRPREPTRPARSGEMADRGDLGTRRWSRDEPSLAWGGVGPSIADSKSSQTGGEPAPRHRFRRRAVGPGTVGRRGSCAPLSFATDPRLVRDGAASYTGPRAAVTSPGPPSRRPRNHARPTGPIASGPGCGLPPRTASSGTPDKEAACSSFDPAVNAAIVTCPAILRTR
jgi:hypothetical protein